MAASFMRVVKLYDCIYSMCLCVGLAPLQMGTTLKSNKHRGEQTLSRVNSSMAKAEIIRGRLKLWMILYSQSPLNLQRTSVQSFQNLSSCCLIIFLHEPVFCIIWSRLS